MSDYVKQVMEIITAIQHYVDKYGNNQEVEKYYQAHGTYDGIIEYLNELEKEKQKTTLGD